MGGGDAAVGQFLSYLGVSRLPSQVAGSCSGGKVLGSADRVRDACENVPERGLGFQGIGNHWGGGGLMSDNGQEKGCLDIGGVIPSDLYISTCMCLGYVVVILCVVGMVLVVFLPMVGDKRRYLGQR